MIECNPVLDLDRLAQDTLGIMVSTMLKVALLMTAARAVVAVPKTVDGILEQHNRFRCVCIFWRIFGLYGDPFVASKT